MYVKPWTAEEVWAGDSGIVILNLLADINLLAGHLTLSSHLCSFPVN